MAAPVVGRGPGSRQDADRRLPPWSRVATLARVIANVRSAKARLSELLERAASGEEVLIISAGRPKARLVAVTSAALPFRVNRRLLALRPRRRGRSAEDIVRGERDARD